MTVGWASVRECHQRSWQVADVPGGSIAAALLSAGAGDRWQRGAGKTGASEFRGAPARVVFADDDAVLRQLLRGLLSFLPHVTVVGEAADGIEAVQLVAQHYPDTVLLDIGMPRLDGFGAAEVIRPFRLWTRLMLHTAEPNAEKRRRAKALGLPLLDKLQLNTTTDLVEQYAGLRRAPARDGYRATRAACPGWSDRLGRARRQGRRIGPVLQPRLCRGGGSTLPARERYAF